MLAHQRSWLVNNHREHFGRVKPLSSGCWSTEEPNCTRFWFSTPFTLHCRCTLNFSKNHWRLHTKFLKWADLPGTVHQSGCGNGPCPPVSWATAKSRPLVPSLEPFLFCPNPIISSNAKISLTVEKIIPVSAANHLLFNPFWSVILTSPVTPIYRDLGWPMVKSGKKTRRHWQDMIKQSLCLHTPITVCMM